MSDSSVKRTREKRYIWPPPKRSEDVYVVKHKNPIHSILAALPILMLVAGLYIYYSAEFKQSHGALIMAESHELGGVFSGLSFVNSGANGRHYLWLQDNGKTLGFRIQPDQALKLQELEKGGVVSLRVAPTVAGSKTQWVWRVKQGEKIILDTIDSP